MIGLVEGFGFRLSRTDGSHHIFVHSDIPELLNLQEVKEQAKPYHINIFYPEEDGGYIADLPDLEACSAFGETPEEALREGLKG